MRLSEITQPHLYHGTSFAALVQIAHGDTMLAVRSDMGEGGISFTTNFEMAKEFAQRAVGNAIAYGYNGDPSDEIEMLCLAERAATKHGEDGAVMVFDRGAIIRSFGADRLRPIEGDVEWGHESRNEQEERLITGLETNPQMMQFVRRLVIINPARYQTFKDFVLRHQKSYAATFARIEHLSS